MKGLLGQTTRCCKARSSVQDIVALPTKKAIVSENMTPSTLSAAPARTSRSRVGRRVLRAGIVTCVAAALASCSFGTGEPENSSSPLRVRLMTGKQYSLTVAHIFGADIADSVPAPLPPLPRVDGLLAAGAASIGLTSDQLQQVQQAAAAVATQVVDEEHRDFLIPCKPASLEAADADCARMFLGQVGRLWYRHPLEEAKLAQLVQTAGESADQLQDFYAGLASVLEGMLFNPRAMHIIDVAEPDPQHAGEYRLDAYSLASRLSFFLWNAAPDDELLRSAESGELHTRKGLERAVDRMLASARIKDGVRAFFDDMLDFTKFDSLAKDPLAYPAVTGATLADAREQTLRTIVDHLVTKHEDYRALFTTRNTFMSMNLAVIYGVPTVNGWVPYEFPEDSPRAGLLTQVSFLAEHSHPVRSSPTLRGKALRELFLCQVVPPPPPDVDFSLLEDADESLRTARERLAVHASNASCAGCHLITDPMGLALENFDGAGHFRETERGAALDTSGNLDGAQFDGVEGLGQALHDHPGLPSCLVTRVYGYGTGGPLSMGKDREILAHFAARFEKAGYRLPELLREIALSRAFSAVRPGAQPAATPASTIVDATRAGAEQSASNPG